MIAIGPNSETIETKNIEILKPLKQKKSVFLWPKNALRFVSRKSIRNGAYFLGQILSAENQSKIRLNNNFNLILYYEHTDYITTLSIFQLKSKTQK